VNHKTKTAEDVVTWRAQECTCPAQKELTYCHPDCLMLKAIVMGGGKIEEVKQEKPE
jgi:hypothetical protein